MTIDRARWIGAVAGLAPTAVIGAWWAWSGVGVSATDAMVSLALLAAIAMSAGWIAGPLAAAVPRALLKASIGYAIAVIGTTMALSVLQAAADTVAAGDASVGGLAGAIVDRALVGVAGIAYLILPTLAFGALWTLAARMIQRATGARRTA